MSRKQSHYIQLDLIILLIALIVVSVLAIYNAQQLGQYVNASGNHENFALKQIIYFAIGISFMAALQFVDLDQLYKSSIYFYIVGVLSVVILHFSPNSIARPVNNAKSWFNGDMIPFFTIQPSEFAKIALILCLAMIIVKHKEKYEKSTVNSDLWLILKIVIITLIPVAFIIKQPDLGTSIVFFFIAGILIILSGIDWKILSVLIVGGAASLVLAILLIVNFPELAQTVLGIKPYQIERVMTWFDPTQQVDDDRFQIDRSLLTVGSGQLTGKGMNHAEVALPEAHTDFIFSIIGESFGFIGSSIVIFVFFLLIYKLVTLGMKSYEFNPFGSYICFGFMSLILIHTFQNIGMTIGIMPITGIPLLFVSYGGSTTLSTMIGFGIVYRVAIEQSKQKDFLFN
ncbi:FtsW/RodA/SpoVE family cell cycle protein [Pseudogracilibacillus auburnensis]|uniref:Cell elongation-specific peptidoglycan biosynthesis regulator RodA n=1 Tax=Pseudogracilibacillus auburnensis TaxID=1494959 RepID=A0A2V3W0M0_9BACI|nr:FtsW/RodA/SpoVE family cell cycle protein [Pseudogracilibacillus auburnensis]MBO1002750.1 rod shape-determining protein RodA [Pseudogracilibacillus auburnensis]PXW87863.1 cell elongation-specific peptidoglycan biosynthesis regulator RodA [Pseudogracilibacillus auburnensis]